ncbi:MAG: hypothetical protein K2X86_18670 [Cytophagaceae bacterium]|nr:hypothetical protein [Cytophagaceae bacterium]
MKKYTLLFAAIFIFSASFSQRVYLRVYPVSPLNKSQKELFTYKTFHQDSLSVLAELKQLLLRFHKESYLTAGIDTVYKSKDTLVAGFKGGESFNWYHLSKGNLNELLLNKSGYKEKFFRNTPFRITQLQTLEENILKYSENHGYPFASVSLDSLNLEENNFYGALNYQAGPLITFDSIVILGKTKTKNKFLIRYLRIFPNEPFSQEKLNNINRLLKDLPYLKQTRPYTLIFQNNKAILQLFLEDKRSNQIDGIVGFLPNETSKKKLLVTGELNLNLKNLFGTGKTLSAQWKKFNLSSQTLDLAYYHPKLLSSNIDVKIDFNLLKQDSSFLNISRLLTLSQRTGRYGKVNLYGGIRTSRELLSNELADKSVLPVFSNYDFLTYGLGYDWNNLDDPFYPHKGWFISSRMLVGNKNILKSSGFNDSLYNKVQLRSVQLNVNMMLEKYFSLGKRSVLLGKGEAGTIFNNEKNIFFNDMFRVGGLKSLRGFNENNFYAMTFAVATLEYRFFTDETSYLFLFYDQGYVQNKLNKALPEDFPFGFGAGVSFTTNVGIFNFVYSLGQAKSQPLSLNLSKIHFGIISRF